jgi:hypothetical protein
MPFPDGILQLAEFRNEFLRTGLFGKLQKISQLFYLLSILVQILFVQPARVSQLRGEFD